jgi:hypothetical protein
MDKNWGEYHYKSRFVEDRADGFAGLRLTRTLSRTGEQSDVAQVSFWDAGGQFSFETFGADVPINIVRELISEAEEIIKTK